MSGMLSQVQKRLEKFKSDIDTGRRKKWTGELPSDVKKTPLVRPPQKGSGARPLPRRELGPRPPASFDIEGEGAEHVEPEPEMAGKSSDKKARRPATPDPSGAKTVGVKVPPREYAALQRLQEVRKFKSIKEAMLAVLADWMNRGAPFE
jgi:hypothetical protein